MAEQYDYGQLSTYIGNLVDEAINSTMSWCGFSGSVQSGFEGMMGGTEPIRISPLGGHYEGSTMVPGGQATNPTTGTPALFLIPPSQGWPFDDLPSMQDFYWKQISALFDPWWQMPQPSGFDGQLRQAQKLASTLSYHVQSNIGPASTDYFDVNDDLSGIQLIQQRVSNLDGNAILAFESNFSDRLDDVVNAQDCAAVLAWVGVAGEKKIWEKAQESLANVAGSGVEAMKHARPSGGGGIKALINVLGAVSLIAAEVVTEGWATPLVVAGVMAQTSSDFIPEPAEEEHAPLDSDNPIGVIDNLRKALDDIKARIRQEEEWLGKRMSWMTDQMYGGKRGGFDLSEPALAHEDRKSELYKATEIKADYDVIKTVAQTYMQTVIGALSSASGLAADSGPDPWVRPAELGSGYSGPYAEWSGLNIAIKGVTAETAKSLDTAAQALVILANDFGKSDAQVKADMDGLATKLDQAKAAAARNAH